MKRLSQVLTGVLLLAGVTPASAQRLEFGGFGAYTRFDDALLLTERIGGGARLGLHLNRFLGIEVLGAYLGPSATAGNPSNFFHLGSASVLLGGGGDRFSLFVLGGYSRLDMGTTAPYNYWEPGFHGGAGFRIGLTGHLAVRAEGRAILISDDDLAAGSATHMIGSVGLSYFTRSSRRRQQPPEEPRPAPIVAPEPEPVAPEPVAPQPVAPQPVAPEPVVRPAPRTPVAAPAEAPAPRRARMAQAPLPHAEQFEVNAFGSFTRFDQGFGLASEMGGGIRIGYFMSDRLNIELEGSYSTPTDATGTLPATLALGSASLGYNFHFGRHAAYLLGGYTRATWGDSLDFQDNMLHAGLGVRVFLTRGIALRLEGRGLYTPNSNGTGSWATHMTGSAGLSFLASPPRQLGPGGVGGRSYQWYWGGQGGVFLYKTNLLPAYYDPLVGGHWMITARRTALYLAYEQAFFLTQAKAEIFDPTAESTSLIRQIDFSDMRRIMFGVLAHPAQKVIEPFGGVGFAIMQVLNPTPDCSADCETIAKASEAFDRAEQAASKAFFWIMGGMQMNYSNRLNVFGHYILTSSGRGFLLDGNTHTLQGGIRLSLGSAKEGLTERN
jgi:outer membrane protein with beta-barrel domain